MQQLKKSNKIYEKYANSQILQKYETSIDKCDKN